MVNIKLEVIGVRHTNQLALFMQDKPKNNTTYRKNVFFEDGQWWYQSEHQKSIGFRQTLDSHIRKNAKKMYVNGKYIPVSHPLHKPGNYKSFEDAAFSSLEKYESSTEGEVYIITNPAWEGWIKIGMAVDAEDRCKQYQTSSPMRDFKLEYKRPFNDRRGAESQAHKLCANQTKEVHGEWFKLNVSVGKKIIDNIENKQ